MDKLNELIRRCKGPIIIKINTHREYSRTVQQYVLWWGDGHQREQIDDAVFAEMERTDTIIFLLHYPEGTTDTRTVWHYDVEKAVDQALKDWITMEKLKQLIALCKASVSIEVNKHRDYYESVEESLRDTCNWEDTRREIDNEVYAQMISRDTVVRIQFYPNTPVGFYLIYHYDLEKALDLALSVLEENKAE